MDEVHTMIDECLHWSAGRRGSRAQQLAPGADRSSFVLLRPDSANSFSIILAFNTNQVCHVQILVMYSNAPRVSNLENNGSATACPAI